jgi:hypothetical protein
LVPYEYTCLNWLSRECKRMDRDALLLAGTIAGFVAAMLSIIEKWLNIRDRFHGERAGVETTPADHLPRERSLRAKVAPWKIVNVSSHLLFQELSVIVGAGLLLNYLGLIVSMRLESILYLDMIGTAVVALLLGPWWGGLTALLSSALVNWLLYPESGADLIIFPWALVNMTGGFFWGFIGRRAWFRQYLGTPRASVLSHAWYLLAFGVLGAGVMGIPGTIVQAALSAPGLFALNPDLARSLERMFAEIQMALWDRFDPASGEWGESTGWFFLSWIQNWLRYIPDKTISAAVALAVLKHGFPLFERELIHGGLGKRRLRDTWAAPVILGCLYLPVFLALLLADAYGGAPYWPFWATPWLIIMGGIAVMRRWGPSDEDARHACIERAERYAQALKPIEREPVHEFGQRLTAATLTASVLFALCLPIVLVDFYRMAFNFFCIVYGCLLAIYLVRVAISQNLSVARAGR